MRFAQADERREIAPNGEQVSTFQAVKWLILQLYFFCKIALDGGSRSPYKPASRAEGGRKSALGVAKFSAKSAG